MIIDGRIFTIVLQENGKFGYRVEGEIMYLSKEDMNEFRVCLMEAIGEAEDLYNNQNKKRIFNAR